MWFGCGGRLIDIWVGTWERGFFATVLPTFVLVSRIQLAQRYRDFGHYLSAASSSRLEAMVGDVLGRVSSFRFGGGILIDIWVGTWDRVFRCGASDSGFGFKI